MATLTLDPRTFATSLPLATVWLLADCMEFRGKQELWVQRRPELLDALRQQAIVQSVESSNRIEGVTVQPDRLRPIVLGRAAPRDRSEEELAGYRKSLRWIFNRKRVVRLDAKTILRLHALAQGGTTGDAGQFKSRDNQIIELRPGVGRVVRFERTPARLAPGAIDELCNIYNKLCDSDAAPPLLLIATFVFDFLCIHPFRDGNGRVSRLLTTLLLEQHQFVVSRFISLERLIENSRDDYYSVLHICSQNWAKGKNQITPWWNYFLSIVRRGYTDFASSVENSTRSNGKAELARQLILAQAAPFTLATIAAAAPGLSSHLIKKVLSGLKKEGAIKVQGHGRGARWKSTK